MHPPPESLSMTHEAAIRPVSRLWLRAFAGIVAVLFGAPSTRAGAVLNLSPADTNAIYAAVASGSPQRKPVSAFATEKGVYELDQVTKKIRVWPRSARKGELENSRFNGADAGGNHSFSNPKRMTKKPGENLIAVVDASVYNENLGLVPGVSFYEFEETIGSDGDLASVEFTFKGRFEHKLFRYAEDVAFFPDGAAFDVAVAVTYENVQGVDDEARQSWIALGSGGLESPALADVFFAARDKAAYTNAEPVAAWPTTLAVGGDSAIWAGSRSMGSVLRYDAVGGDYTTEVVRWTWVYELDGGPTGYASDRGHYEPSADPNPCGVVDFIVGEMDQSGSENNHIGAPGGIRIWENSPAGRLLLVADTDNNRVVAFDAAGNEAFRFGTKGSLPGEFTNPHDVWVNDAGTELVVADYGNGCVQIFALDGVSEALESYELSGFTTVEWEDKYETIARTNAVFYFESDSIPVTNWLVAASASTSNRTYAVSVESDPAGAVSLVSDSVVIPAGATRAPIVFYVLDGVAGGTPCTIRVGGEEGSFTISNVPPSLATGSEGSWTNIAAYAHSYAYADEVAATVANAEFEIRLVESEAIHFHARAADVGADEPLSYEWRIVGTTTNMLVVEKTYYTNFVATAVKEFLGETNNPPKTFVQIPEETALSFPDGPNGGKLYIVTNEMLSVSTNYVKNFYTGLYEPQLATNNWELVVTTNELFESVVETIYRNPASWAHLFFDGNDADSFIEEDTTLTGSDPEFSPTEGVLYFAMLTVTDKDGASVRTVDTAADVYWCFQSTGGTPPPDGAIYAATFTDVSGTNVAFVLTIVSGEPAGTDQVSLQYAKSLSEPWSTLFQFKPGVLIRGGSAVSGDSVTFVTREKANAWLTPGSDSLDVLFVYAEDPKDGIRFYQITQP